MSDQPSLPDSPAQPRPETVGLRLVYARAGAVWSVIAALLALLAFLQPALGMQPIAPFMAFGRAILAARHVLFFGAISLPFAGFLLAEAGIADAEAGVRRLARRGLLIWNIGLGLGSASILTAPSALRGLGIHARPETWAAAPTAFDALLSLGVLAWMLALWRSHADRQLAPSAALRAGLVAGLCLLVLLLVGNLLVGSLLGAPQAIAGSLYARGLPLLWAFPAAVAVLAALLPSLLKRALFSARLFRFGLWGWLILAALSLPRELGPDLLPDWTMRLSESAGIALLLPTLCFALACLGSWLPGDDKPAPWPRSETRRTLLWLCFGGGVLLVASAASDSLMTPTIRRLLQFSPLSPSAAFLPANAGLWPLAVAAALASAGPSLSAQSARLIRFVALGAALAGPLITWPLGLAAGAAEASLGLLTIESSLRALVEILRLGAAGLLAWALWRDDVVSLPGGPWTQASQTGEPGGRLLAAAGGALALSLLVIIFLPLADPGVFASSPRADARALESGTLPADGRRIYSQEGCALCHSQRVRDVSEGSRLGSVTSMGDYARGPALAGYRRAGPDLTWAGERFEEPDLMMERLAVHAAGGQLALPWLLERGGPTPAGQALSQYLLSLSSRGPALSPSRSEGGDP